MRIEGRVQGVGFRYWTQSRAVTLGLRGWVRNRVDGTVEALFHGDAAAVDKMIEDCRRGPTMARVASVITNPAEPPATETFTPRPTA